ncbi:MAG TPA: hypothetical protein PLD95_03620 [bacterium]|jgi:hypothetical protein|nr:hypothetical protein [bacterium]HOG38533.1 hypothetical protein [bacterium]HQI03403.1 hypothetical protein [bacterium]
MNKKIIILLLLFVILIAFFLLLIYYDIVTSNKKQPIVKEHVTEKQLEIQNLLLNIGQNKDGLFLDFNTKDKYACADLIYDFSVNQENSLIKLDLKNITQKISCNFEPIQIKKQEKIGEIKNWNMDVSYNNRIFQYQIKFENNKINIVNINNSEDQNILKFENQSYAILSNNVARLRIDYYDKNAEVGINNLLKRLNVARKEVSVSEAELAFKDFTIEPFGTSAKYSMVKYFTFEDENIFKKIANDFKKIDCYKDKPDYKNCISLDFRTSTGKRYCTWLNVTY